MKAIDAFVSEKKRIFFLRQLIVFIKSNLLCLRFMKNLKEKAYTLKNKKFVIMYLKKNLWIFKRKLMV